LAAVAELRWRIFINSLRHVRVIRKEVKGYQLNPTQMFFDMQKVALEK